MKTKKAGSEAKGAAEQRLPDRLVDEALQDTFPASDPPFFVGAGAEPAAAAEESPAAVRKHRDAAKQDRD